LPFLGFRLQRTLSGHALRSPEERARVAQEAMAVVNEHPDLNVRKLYAGQVASHVGLPVNDLVAAAARQNSRPTVRAVAERRRLGTPENAEFVVIALLVQRFFEIGEWLIEALFADDTARRAFLALAESGGVLQVALERADPEARELLERAAVDDVVADPLIEARNLIAAAARRELAKPFPVDDVEAIRTHRDCRLRLEQLDDPLGADAAAEALLGWLQGRFEERA
jgi:DNA primase